MRRAIRIRGIAAEETQARATDRAAATAAPVGHLSISQRRPKVTVGKLAAPDQRVRGGTVVRSDVHHHGCPDDVPASNASSRHRRAAVRTAVRQRGRQPGFVDQGHVARAPAIATAPDASPEPTAAAIYTRVPGTRRPADPIRAVPSPSPDAPVPAAERRLPMPLLGGPSGRVERREPARGIYVAGRRVAVR